MPLRIKKPSVKRAAAGDQFVYRDFGVNGGIMTIQSESEEPGYKGFYAYLARFDGPDDRTGHKIIYGADLFKENSLYEPYVPKRRKN